MKNMLDIIRQRLGSGPRTLDPRYKSHFLAQRPGWLDEHNLLPGYHDRCPDAVKHQPIHWAAFCLVGSLTNEEDDERIDMMGNVVFGTDPMWDDNVDELRDIAGDLYDLAGRDLAPRDPQLAAFHQALQEKKSYVLNLPVPEPIAGGNSLWVTTVAIHQNQIPNNLVDSIWVPVFAATQPNEFTVIVDQQFWPKDMREAWCGAPWRWKTF